MPLDFLVPDILPENYDRFVRGLDDLSDGAQRKARRAAPRVAPSDPTTVTVAIPNWDDVFRIQPRPQVGPELSQRHYAAIRAGNPSPLAPELQEELKRRQTRWRLLQTSAQPAYARAYGEVMTAIDNVQDFIGTVAVVGRLVVVPPLRAAAQLGLLEQPFLRFAGRAGLAVFGRALPVVGLILTISDLMRHLNLFGVFLMPWYSAACASSKEALLAGMPALLVGRAPKSLIGAFEKRTNPTKKLIVSTAGTRRGWAVGPEVRRGPPIFGSIAKNLRERVETGKLRPRWYEIIEGAQTTQELFGRGLILGGIVGLIQESAFGIEQSARGKRVVVTTQPLPNDMLQRYRSTLRKVPTAQLHDLRTAADVLSWGPLIQSQQETFTFIEHAEYLAAHSAALSFLRPFIEAPELEPLADAALDAYLRPPTYLTDDFDAEHVAAEGRGAPLGRWPLPGNPDRVRGIDLIAATADAVPEVMRELIEPRRDTIEGAFLASLVSGLTDRWAILYQGGADGVREQLSPPFRTMESLIVARRWVNTGEPEGKIADFFDHAETWMRDRRAASIPQPALDELASAAGLTLIRLLPPDAPFPTASASSLAR